MSLFLWVRVNSVEYNVKDVKCFYDGIVIMLNDDHELVYGPPEYMWLFDRKVVVNVRLSSGLKAELLKETEPTEPRWCMFWYEDSLIKGRNKENEN